MIAWVVPAEQAPHYPRPWKVAGGLLWAALTLRPRSFAQDSRRAVSCLHPPMEVLGGEHVPANGPCLVVCNHYSGPGFQAWWIAWAVTAAVSERRAPEADSEMRWVMTAAWRFESSRWKQRFLSPLSRWAFARVARVYGFITMPPMPPIPEDTQERAVAVLRTVRLARSLARSGGLLGLSPEGRDTATGLAEVPPGAGEFLALLVETGLPVLPAGVSETGGCLRVVFGPVFVPGIPTHRAARDANVGMQVMGTIARLLNP